MMFYSELSFSLTSNTQYNELITISSYILLSCSALNFPIHTLRLLYSHSLRLLHSLSLTSQLKLCTTSQLTPYLFSHPFVFFSRPITHVFRKHPWPGSRRPFLRNYSIEGPTTHWWTRRRLGSRDIVYGSTDILDLFVHHTTCISTKILEIVY